MLMRSLSWAVLLAALGAVQRVPGFPARERTLPGWSGESVQAIEELDEAPAGLPRHEEWSGEIIQLSWKPRAYLLKGFLSQEECDHLIGIAEPKMRKSTVADSVTGKRMDSSVRTSTGTFLRRRQDSVVANIERRVAQVTMVPEENQEGMQILHYRDGQKYEPHHDYFHDKYNQSPERGGQRLVTMLMYLTTVPEGGETVFPRADRKVHGPGWSPCALNGLAVKAVKGDALMFFSLHPDGTEDPASLHGSCPTTVGDKWSATKWIHVNSPNFGQSDQEERWAGKDVSMAGGSACVDAERECSTWAAAGECASNPRYMLTHCRKACKTCE